MNNTYVLRSPIRVTGRAYGVSFVRDASFEDRKRRADFHIASGDYFATLATIMGLVADAVASGNVAARDRGIRTLMELREDLMYLHENYVIRRK